MGFFFVFLFPAMVEQSPPLFGASGAFSHCHFSYRCQQPSYSSCDIIPSPKITPILSKTNVFSLKAEGIMICWDIQVLLFRLINPNSFESCKVPARTPQNKTEVLFLIPLMGFYFFWSTASSSSLRKVGNTFLSVWKVQKQKKMAKHWKRRIICFLG